MPREAGSDLLGLEILDMYARVGLDGSDIRSGDASSARTSDIARSLDGSSSAGASESCDDGATTAASTSYSVTESDSDSNGGFSDMEW